MINTEHLTPDKITALKEGSLSKAETISALEHIGECEQCADIFAESYNNTELLNLSSNFKDSVFSAIDKEKNNSVIKKEKNRNRKREFCFYSVKVSIAACITLALLFSGTFNHGMNMSRTVQADLSGVNVITENLRGFSDRLIDFETTKNIKEEQ